VGNETNKKTGGKGITGDNIRLKRVSGKERRTTTEEGPSQRKRPHQFLGSKILTKKGGVRKGGKRCSDVQKEKGI